MSSANIRRVKTIKYSHMLDHLVSIAEYSIFTDGYSKFANIVIYNSSDKIVRAFEMRLDIYDDNKAKIQTKTVTINNLNLRPKLFLKLKSKISLPMEAFGFNYSTIAINKDIDASYKDTSPLINPTIRSLYPALKTREGQVAIKQLEVSESIKENVIRKRHLKTHWLFLLPVIGIASIALTTIYFNSKLGSFSSSTTREKGSGELLIAEKNDFNYTITNNTLVLNEYTSKKKIKMYLDPSVFISDYSGQTIILNENCFRDSKIERFIVEGPCEIGPACFAYAYNLEYFACVNYTFKDVNYAGSVNKISSNCFFGCSKLTTFKYQETYIDIISAGAFYACSNLSNFVMPSVTRIDRQAFYKCTSFNKKINLPMSIEKIGVQSFDESSVREITFSNPYTSKEEDSFPEGSKFFGSAIYDENGREK